ncbi:hypothetical protein SAMN04488109_2706 [Chryseolinea serpens]|uniref:Knr4/Smi1-like domain-containing protein n=1 Tax=Chryseolinea serpens TaxID=947013 RepID=A0A1M5P6Q8_9BACT|nr:SMI1/KNR4 family protein [Chryseolinea serpens]SHG97466.1 hypothetical protein SAMN04488109_2706 [Chryseolinea serpens]
MWGFAKTRGSIEFNGLLDELREFWKDQGIETVPVSWKETALGPEGLRLPADFRVFYSKLNGMSNLYPNEMDSEGFLFYPIDVLVTVREEFDEPGLPKNIIVFAEYMHKSWWYGIELRADGTYVIGIIPDRGRFKVITNSLEVFMRLYLMDASELYDYG